MSAELVIAITGAARGIGLATAQRLTATGAHVAIGDLDAELATSEATRIGALGLTLDVTQERSFETFLATTQKQLGAIDVLINNAGIMPTGPFLEQSPTLLDSILAVNLGGTARGCRLALPDMLARGNGQIINIASVAGRTVAAGMASYCASKHAVVGLTRALRREYTGRGVRLTLVMPTFTNTRLVAGAHPHRVPVVEPRQVAAAIAHAISHPRDELIVPRSAAVLTHAFERLLPRRAADAISRSLGADLMFLTADGHGR